MVKTLSLYCHELIGKIKEHEGKKIWNRIKETIDFEKFDNSQMLVDTDDKLPDGIMLL